MKTLLCSLNRFLNCFLLFTLALPLMTSSARAVPIASPAEFADTSKEEYQLGSTWDRSVIMIENLPTHPPQLRRAALATARVGQGTGFYLGKFSGLHIIATNHHVCPVAFQCLSTRAVFPLLDLHSKLMKFIGTWPEIDLTLMTLDLRNPEDERRLLAVAGNFAFDQETTSRQELLTLGFGAAENEARELTVDQGADCRVFSGTGAYQKLSDPDRAHPAKYQAWSFASGCDISHGDSGSPVIDRATGKLLGLVWTGGFPKPASVQNSDLLDRLLASQGPEIWTGLSYVVPARKIGEHLREVLADPRTQPESKPVLTELLSTY